VHGILAMSFYSVIYIDAIGRCAFYSACARVYRSRPRLGTRSASTLTH